MNEARAFTLRKWMVLLLVTLTVLTADQLTKRWADQKLRSHHAAHISLLDDYLMLSYVRNPGAAWGFLARSNERFRHPFFLTISVVAMLFILYIHYRLEPGQRLLLIAVSLVMGGAVGNFVDRLRLHYVIDFIQLHWKHRYRWPTFNIADVAITVGVALLLLEMIFGSAHRRTAEGERAP